MALKALFAVVVLALGAGTSYGASAITVASTFEQPLSFLYYGFGIESSVALSFTTGSSPGIVKAATLSLGRQHLSSNAPTFGLTLLADDGGGPGAPIVQFAGAHTPPGPGQYFFTFTADQPVAANTTYWLAVAISTPQSGGQWQTAVGQSPGPWTLGRTYFRTDGPWKDTTASNFIPRVRISAVVVPEPAAAALFAMALVATAGQRGRLVGHAKRDGRRGGIA